MANGRFIIALLACTMANSRSIKDWLQNAASEAPNGQFSTIELKRSLFYTKFINERPLPGLSPKCCFWSSKWPVLYNSIKTKPFLYKISQQTATSRAVSKMLLLELQMANSLQLN